MNKTTEHQDGIVIAGGGLAGQRCAETLRRVGYDGAIRIVCAEDHAPYDRPPLSKKLLTDPSAGSTLGYRSAQWYQEQAVELLLGVRAAGLRPDERRLVLSDGSTLGYDQLLIATGSRPRTLPLLEGYGNVAVLRTLDESVALREALARGGPLVVIGAGFIGQEVAATARGLGLEVTIIEAAPQPLLGVLGSQMGGWFAGLHREEGVEVLTGCTVDRVQGNGRVDALHLSDGRRVPAEHVLVGVGVSADVGWLAGTDLATEAGVPVDADGRTGTAGVFAAGDVAATFEPQLGRHVPGSHWEAAARQGARAARVMLDLDPGQAPPASFWSDQYGMRIQYLGRAQAGDDLEIDGDLAGRDFTATFSRAGRPVAALLVNRPRSLPAARALIEKGTP